MLVDAVRSPHVIPFCISLTSVGGQNSPNRSTMIQAVPISTGSYAWSRFHLRRSDTNMSGTSMAAKWLPYTNEVYTSWALPGGVGIEQWPMTGNVQAFLDAARTGQEENMAVTVIVAPAAGQIKGVDGPRLGGCLRPVRGARHDHRPGPDGVPRLLRTDALAERPLDDRPRRPTRECPVHLAGQ
jgi:hypothetical protein